MRAAEKKPGFFRKSRASQPGFSAGRRPRQPTVANWIRVPSSRDANTRANSLSML
jgi:hypothetical protein